MMVINNPTKEQLLLELQASHDREAKLKKKVASLEKRINATEGDPFSLGHGITVFFAIIDKKNKLLYGSPEFKLCFGVTEGEITPVAWADLFSENFSRLEKQLPGGEPLRVRVKQLHQVCLGGKGYDCVVSAEFDQSGEPQRYTVYGKTISGLADQEGSFHSKAVRLGELLTKSSMIIFASDPEEPGRILYVSDNIERFLGFTPSELIANTEFKDRVHPEDRTAMRVFEEEVRVHAESSVVYRHVHKDGHFIWIRQVGVMFTDPSGNPVEMISYCFDVNHAKRNEAELQKSRSLFQGVIDSSLSVIYVKDREGRYLLGNKKFEEFSGHKLDDLVGKTDSMLYDKRQNIRYAKEDKLVFEKGMTLQYEESLIVNKLVRHFFTTKIPLCDEQGNVYALCGNSWDMTALREAQDALAASEERYRLLVEESAQGIGVISGYNPRVVFANKAFARIFGYSVNELLEMAPEAVRSRIYADDHDFVWKSYHERLRSELPKSNYECRIVQKSGAIRYVEVYVNYFAYRGPAIQAILLDITDRKIYEEKLRKSEALLADAQRIAVTGSWGIDVTTREIVWSDQIFRIFGLSPEENRASIWYYFFCVHPEDRNKIVAGYSRLFQEGKFDTEFRIVQPTGEVRHVKDKGELVYNSKNRVIYVQGSIQDITSQKLVEEELRKSRENLEERVEERTRALSEAKEQLSMLAAHQQDNVEMERTRIAREVHDELGQNMTALKIGLKLLEGYLPEGEEKSRKKIHDLDKLVEGTIASVQKISRELRPAQLDDLGLSAAMEWHVRQFQQETDIRIDLALNVDDRGLDKAATTALYRVFQEAMTNIVRHAQATAIKVCLYMSKSEFVLEVSDNGVGFVPEDLSSPKSLGLMGMRERIHALGGHMEISSMPGTGTRIVAALPMDRVIGMI